MISYGYFIGCWGDHKDPAQSRRGNAHQRACDSGLIQHSRTNKLAPMQVSNGHADLS